MENLYLCARLRTLNNEIRRCLDKIMRGGAELDIPGEHDNITCTNRWIIAHLYASELEGRCVYQRDIEKEFGITRSTASKVLILLEKKGYVKREGVSHDARLKKLILTDKSRDISRAMHESAVEMEQSLIDGFTKEELDTLRGYLDRVQKNLAAAALRKE